MWTIDYYSEQVQQAIQELPAGLQARYVYLTSLMITFGANLGMPHTQAMGDGLFELRLKSKEGIASSLSERSYHYIQYKLTNIYTVYGSWFSGRFSYANEILEIASHIPEN